MLLGIFWCAFQSFPINAVTIVCHAIKGDFYSSDYFHLLIIASILMRILKIKTPYENCRHVPYNDKKQIVR